MKFGNKTEQYVEIKKKNFKKTFRQKKINKTFCKCQTVYNMIEEEGGGKLGKGKSK